MKGIILTIALFGICTANAQNENFIVEQYMKVLDHKDSTIDVATNHLQEVVEYFWLNAVELGIVEKDAAEKKMDEIANRSFIDFFLEQKDTAISESEWQLVRTTQDFSDIVDIYFKKGQMKFADSLKMISAVENITIATVSLFYESNFLIAKIQEELAAIKKTDNEAEIDASITLLTAYQIELELIESYTDDLMAVNDKIMAMTKD